MTRSERGKQCLLWSHHHKKCENCHFFLFLCDTTPSHSSFWNNKPLVGHMSQDGWHIYFLPSPSCFPEWLWIEAPLRRAKAGQWKSREESRALGAKQCCGDLSLGHRGSVGIFSFQHRWIGSVCAAGTGSMHVALFSRALQFHLLFRKMCVCCLGTFLNKPKACRCRADYSSALHEQPRSPAWGRSGQGQVNHRHSPGKVKNHKQTINW